MIIRRRVLVDGLETMNLSEYTVTACAGYSTHLDQSGVILPKTIRLYKQTKGLFTTVEERIGECNDDTGIVVSGTGDAILSLDPESSILFLYESVYDNYVLEFCSR